MKILTILVASVCIWPAAAIAHPAPTQDSAADARDNALATLHNVVVAVRTPANLSIDQLSRQLEFNYDQGECLDTYSHVNYCAYLPKGSRGDVGALRKFTLGRDRHTGATGGAMHWQRADSRVCLTKRDIAKLLGEGARPKEPSIPWIPPSAALRPAPVDELEYTTVPGAAPSVSARAIYQNRCLIDLQLDF